MLGNCCYLCSVRFDSCEEPTARLGKVAGQGEFGLLFWVIFSFGEAMHISNSEQQALRPRF
jgi:hypothetical protein